MKTIYYFILALTLILITSCSNKSTLEGEISGLENDTLFLNYKLLAFSDSVITDTLKINNGKFIIKPNLMEAALITITPQKAILEDGSINFNKILTVLLKPGESLKLKGEYSEKAIDFKVVGSKFMETYTQLRSDNLVYSIDINELYIQYDLFANQESPSENSLDSLENLIDSKGLILNNHYLNWIKSNFNTDLAAYLLSRQAVDTVGKYYLEIGEQALNGDFKLVLDSRYDRFLRNQKSKENEAKIVVGAKAPDFSLYDNHSNLMSLLSFRGKYIVLDFWGSWCSWCVKGIPEMKKYYNTYKNKIEIIGIDCKESEDKWKNAISEYQLPWVHLYNSNNISEDVAILYAVKGFPTKIIIDPNMVIVGIFIGESPDFYNKIDELMNK